MKKCEDGGEKNGKGVRGEGSEAGNRVGQVRLQVWDDGLMCE